MAVDQFGNLLRVPGAGQTGEWECFQLLPNRDIWSVRPCCDRRIEAALHVRGKEKAEELRDLLTRLGTKSSSNRPAENVSNSKQKG